MAIFGVREVGSEHDCGTVQVLNNRNRKVNAERAVQAIQENNCSDKIVPGKEYEVHFLWEE